MLYFRSTNSRLFIKIMKLKYPIISKRNNKLRKSTMTQATRILNKMPLPSISLRMISKWKISANLLLKLISNLKMKPKINSYLWMKVSNRHWKTRHCMSTFKREWKKSWGSKSLIRSCRIKIKIKCQSNHDIIIILIQNREILFIQTSIAKPSLYLLILNRLLLR